MSDRIEMTLPADLRYLEMAAQCISKMALLAGFSKEDAANIELAVDEACTNVVMHAFGNDASQQFKLICSFDRREFTVELQDRGRPFDFDAVPEPDVRADLESRTPGGLGIYLIRQVMDEVDYRQETDGLKRLVLKKNIPE